jgi:hypothetical protein
VQGALGVRLFAAFVFALGLACGGPKDDSQPDAGPESANACIATAGQPCPTLSLHAKILQRSTTNDGFVFDSYVYQFEVTELDYQTLVNATYVVAPFLPGLPDGVMRHRVRDMGLVDMQFPPYANPGPYTLTVRLSDGRIFSTKFEHVP